jgi:hypothetical protein
MENGRTTIMAARGKQESTDTTGTTVAAPTTDPKELYSVERLAGRTMERWSNADLREIPDYETAMRVALETYGEVADATMELGNGFALLSKGDKAKLVGKPFLAMYWTFNESQEYGGHFASMAAVTADNQKFIVNDGSAGIFQDLLAFTQEHNGRQGALLCPGGLRESSYPTCPDCGKPRPQSMEECTRELSNGSPCGSTDTRRGVGQTFYLETSRQPYLETSRQPS